MRKLIGLIAAGVLVAAGTVNAAPVDRPTDLSLSIEVQGLDSLTITGSDSVSVDETASTLVIPDAAVSLDSKIVVPVTATTAVFSLTAQTISNQTGTISPSGAANVTGTIEDPCPADPGQACVQQTGIGGIMALRGAIRVHVVKNVVVIPVDLDAAGIGQGGATNDPFTIDAAPWTTQTGSVNTGGSTIQTTGTVSVTGSQFTLVTPTFVSALGNVLPLFTRYQVVFTDGNGLPEFMPEPAALLSIGATLGALALLGRRRR